MKNKKLLIGCGVVALIFLCCAGSAGSFVGYQVYQTEACYNDAYTEYTEAWNAACITSGEPGQTDPDTDCLLPSEIAMPIEDLYTELELECDSTWAF